MSGKNSGLLGSDLIRTNIVIFNKIKPKTKSNTHNKNGIYKIECPDCNKFYVGQMKKKLRDRFVQHRNAYSVSYTHLSYKSFINFSNNTI